MEPKDFGAVLKMYRVLHTFTTSTWPSCSNSTLKCNNCNLVHITGMSFCSLNLYVFFCTFMVYTQNPLDINERFMYGGWCTEHIFWLYYIATKLFTWCFMIIGNLRCTFGIPIIKTIIYSCYYRLSILIQASTNKL